MQTTPKCRFGSASPPGKIHGICCNERHLRHKHWIYTKTFFHVFRLHSTCVQKYLFTDRQWKHFVWSAEACVMWHQSNKQESMERSEVRGCRQELVCSSTGWVPQTGSSSCLTFPWANSWGGKYKKPYTMHTQNSHNNTCEWYYSVFARAYACSPTLTWP